MPLSSTIQHHTRPSARADEHGIQTYHARLEAIAPRLRAMALRVLRDPQSVDDAVQDVLLAVHAIRHDYDPNRPFGRWVGRIAYHRFVDHLRANLRRHILENTLARDGHVLLPSRSEHPAETERETALQHAIEALPPSERRALCLLKLNGLSLVEAASVTGMSVPALKVASHRAIRRLRMVLRRDANVH